MQAEPTRAPGNRFRREERRFEEDVPGRIRHGGALPPHDARQPDCTAIVRDDQHIGFQGDAIAVQQHQRLAVFGKTDGNAAAKRVQIVTMQGLPELQHHIVGDIHDRMQRPQASPLQAYPKPFGRAASRLDVTDDAAGETRASRRRVQRHRKGIFHNRRNLRYRRWFHAYSVQRGHLSGDPQDAETITPVWRDIKVEHVAFHRRSFVRASAGQPHRLDFQAAERQLFGKLFRVRFPLKHFAKPLDIHTHDSTLSGTAR